jgi:hypothetical protein
LKFMPWTIFSSPSTIRASATLYKEHGRSKILALGFRWPNASCACSQRILEDMYRAFLCGSARGFRLC